jgi:hypothetical protein
MYSEIAAKESCTSTASTIAPPDAVIRPQHTLDQPRRGGDHARLDSPGMPPGPPSVATQQGARHVPERDRQAPCAAPVVQGYIASVRLVASRPPMRDDPKSRAPP